MQVVGRRDLPAPPLGIYPRLERRYFGFRRVVESSAWIMEREADRTYLCSDFVVVRHNYARMEITLLGHDRNHGGAAPKTTTATCITAIRKDHHACPLTTYYNTHLALCLSSSPNTIPFANIQRERPSRSMHIRRGAHDGYSASKQQQSKLRIPSKAVSYTHLTLPTKRIV